MNDYLRQILSSRQKKKKLTDKDLKPAAVLLPLFTDGTEYRVLFTRRSEKVLHHKGQISFPGGQPHKKDSDLLQTALRESWEEIGLKPEDVEIIGELDDTPTATSGFIITPFVGIIPYPYIFTPNPQETTEIFDIPLSSLMNSSKLTQELADSGGKLQETYTYKYQGYSIWGATALIIKQLLDTIRKAGGARLQYPGF
jgi:8-oxo-dGTP pyrophosphatase MutT (NUDIX family)